MITSENELIDILGELLKHPENEYIEFKKAENNFDTDKLGKYFSAMSNEATLRNRQYSWIVFGSKASQSTSDLERLGSVL